MLLDIAYESTRNEYFVYLGHCKFKWRDARRHQPPLTYMSFSRLSVDIKVIQFFPDPPSISSLNKRSSRLRDIIITHTFFFICRVNMM